MAARGRFLRLHGRGNDRRVVTSYAVHLRQGRTAHVKAAGTGVTAAQINLQIFERALVRTAQCAEDGPLKRIIRNKGDRGIIRIISLGRSLKSADRWTSAAFSSVSALIFALAR